MIGCTRLLAGLFAGAIWLSGCKGLSTEITSTATPAPPTDIPTTPTSTPEPQAALVNGSAILLADYEADVRRFQAAQTELGIDLATEENYRDRVLQGMIDLQLLVQGSRTQGFEVTEGALMQRVDQLTAERGGAEAMGAWLQENHYTLESFMTALKAETLAAQMVELIAAEVPETIQQVHARHILVSSRVEAEQLRAQVLDGADFAELALANSLDLSTRLAGGDLGWFPRGFLMAPEVEQVVFGLGPGEIGQVVESALGYHVVQTIERGDRALAPDARRALRLKAVEDWLAAQREMAVIEIFVNP